MLQSDELQSDEQRRQQAQTGLTETARAQRRGQRNGQIFFVALLLCALWGVRSCNNYTLMEVREDEAVTVFTLALMNLPTSSPIGFEQSDAAFDVVLGVRKCYEPYVYKAMIQLLSYNWCKTKKKTPDENYLPQAETLLAQAVKLNRKSHEAHYYLAALAFFKNDILRCNTELDQCLKYSEAIEGPAKQQWKDKVDNCKAALAKTPPVFDIMPPRAMVPKWGMLGEAPAARPHGAGDDD